MHRVAEQRGDGSEAAWTRMRQGILPAAVVLALLGILLRAATAAACGGPDGACLGRAADPGGARARYSAEAWERLTRGEVLFGPAIDGAGYTGAMVMDAPAERVWAVLTDFEAWPAFVPNVEAVAVREGDDGALRVRQSLKVAWKRYAYTAACQLDRAAGRVALRLDPSEPSDVDRLEAGFQLVPLADGRTLVRMDSLLEAGAPVPGFVKRALARSAVPDALRAVERETQRREPAPVLAAAL